MVEPTGAHNYSSPPKLVHSSTSPAIPPQLFKSATHDGEASQSISTEEFERAMTNAIADAEGRKSRPNKPFADEDFDIFATLLRQVGKQAWSERPRTYLLLRMIGENRLMDDFVFEGCKDIHFPYSENRLPNALITSSSRQSFLDMQYLVLSPKSADLVLGGAHRHLGKPLKPVEIFYPRQAFTLSVLWDEHADSYCHQDAPLIRASLSSPRLGKVAKV